MNKVVARSGRIPQNAANVGVVEHGNSAILVTLSSDRKVLDRRRINLTEGLPTHPYHHQGSWAVGRYTDSPWAKDITLKDAIALVRKVEKAAAIGAREQLEALAEEIKMPISFIALRQCPDLPPTIEARIRDNRAQSYADTVMYRQALALAAEASDWRVHWYERESVFDTAATSLGCSDIQVVLKVMGKSVGPPWQAKHKLAAAAALAIPI